MCAGLAIERRNFPDALLVRHKLMDRITSRGNGDQEVQFLFRQPTALIPAWHGNEPGVFLWGNRDDRASKLPRTGWCRIESVQEGKWSFLHPEEVEIPCSYGLEKGTWFKVPGGAMKGMLVRDERGVPHVYMLTQPASHYYQVMTRHDREPVFVGGQI